jgi:hypothetical protein
VKGKFAYGISNLKRIKLHQNSFKSLVKHTIYLNLLVLSLVIYKCLHSFNIFAVFWTHINKMQFIKTNLKFIFFAYCCRRCVFCKQKSFRFTKIFKRFQDEYNIVEIELRVVQFWTEILYWRVWFQSKLLPILSSITITYVATTTDRNYCKIYYRYFIFKCLVVNIDLLNLLA